MPHDDVMFILKDRERVHLRMLAIELIAADKIGDAQVLLAKMLTDPELAVAGTCRFCGCTETSPCGVLVHDGGDLLRVTCAWVDRDRTVCSNIACVRKLQLLHPEALMLQTSAESGLITP